MVSQICTHNLRCKTCTNWARWGRGWSGSNHKASNQVKSIPFSASKKLITSSMNVLFLICIYAQSWFISSLLMIFIYLETFIYRKKFSPKFSIFISGKQVGPLLTRQQCLALYNMQHSKVLVIVTENVKCPCCGAENLSQTRVRIEKVMQCLTSAWGSSSTSVSTLIHWFF